MIPVKKIPLWFAAASMLIVLGLLIQRDANMQLFAIVVGISVSVLLFAMAFSYWIYRESQQRMRNAIQLETQHLLELQEETNKQLKQLNVSLRSSEEKLAVTLNSIGDAVITTDAQGYVTHLNPCAEKFTGWMQASAIGRPVGEIFKVVNEETRLPSKLPIMEMVAQGTTNGLEVLLARNGGERAIADSCAPIRDHDGQVVGAVLVFRDVTQEYAAQQAVRDSAALNQTILNAVVDGIITFHARGGMVKTINPAAERMFGYSAAELVGQNFSLLTPDLNGAPSTGSIEYSTDNYAARVMGLGHEAVGRRKDGSFFPMEMEVSEMWLGGQRYITGILRDITMRKRVEVERSLFDQTLQEKNIELESARFVAENANRAKSVFLSQMSHELRTPLNAILGFAQLMEVSSPLPTPGQTNRLQQIIKAGWCLLELINQILDLSVIESGKVSLSLSAVPISEILNECNAMIELQAQIRGIQIKFITCDDAGLVMADRTRVKQAVLNLLSNAIKYNRKQGDVEVRCSATADHVRISVKDSGAGLPPEKVLQLFQPFNRLGQEAGKEEGKGMGLVVSKQLVELMGGNIGVVSTVGQGTEFWIELMRDVMPQPAAGKAMWTQLAPPDPANEIPEIPANEMTKNEKVAIEAKEKTMHSLLYVEDNPANLMLVEQIIADTHSPLRLLSATDGNLGVALARAHKPDAILMDINLPGMSGIEALNILRHDPATRHIPVLALSANVMRDDIERGLQAGFFRYLTKPLKVNEFIKALNEALKVSETEVDNKEKEFIHG